LILARWWASQRIHLTKGQSWFLPCTNIHGRDRIGNSILSNAWTPIQLSDTTTQPSFARHSKSKPILHRLVAHSDHSRPINNFQSFAFTISPFTFTPCQWGTDKQTYFIKWRTRNTLLIYRFSSSLTLQHYTGTLIRTQHTSRFPTLLLTISLARSHQMTTRWTATRLLSKYIIIHRPASQYR